MSILNTDISCFANYSTSDNPRTVNMLDWLKSGKYADRVQQIRTIGDKAERDRIKATLPAITPSGVFTYRGEDHLVKHSGLLQFDIDAKEHRHVANFADLKTHISNISNVAYCGVSVSGLGYWGLVPIEHPDKHKGHFRALHKAFQKFGLNIDTAPQNPASLRGYSYDPNGYFNHNPTLFTALDEPKPAKSFTRTHSGNDTRSDVEALIQQIQADRIDITAGYDQWLRIGFSLVDEFGESGRDLFHAVSQHHPEYKEHEADRQYTNCIRARGSGVTIASFFHICRQFGIELKKDRALERKYESHKSAPFGMNPYTGEVFDERGYPADWDTIEAPEPGTPEYAEAERQAKLEMIQETFDAVPV